MGSLVPGSAFLRSLVRSEAMPSRMTQSFGPSFPFALLGGVFIWSRRGGARLLQYFIVAFHTLR